jgi:hypothetical protein
LGRAPYVSGQVSPKPWLMSDLDDIHDVFAKKIGLKLDLNAYGTKEQHDDFAQYRGAKLLNDCTSGVNMVQHHLAFKDGRLMFGKFVAPWEADSSHSMTSYRAQSGLSSLPLPLEIRLQIYGYLLVSQISCLLYSVSGGYRFKLWKHKDGELKRRSPWPFGIHCRILETCRQVNHETTPILCSRNLFALEFCESVYKPNKSLVVQSSPGSCLLTERYLRFVSRIRLTRGPYHLWFHRKGFRLL